MDVKNRLTNVRKTSVYLFYFAVRHYFIIESKIKNNRILPIEIKNDLIMAPRIINGLPEFEALVGQEIGVSDYLTITQEQINQFADSTLDHQWIHIDPERAKTESPFGTTIAHGYLTVSLLPYLWLQIADVRKVKMLVNYGMEDFKFNQPVKVNDQVRIRVFMDNLTNLRGIIKTRMKVTMEILGNPKPAYSGYILFLYHFTD
jgi:acyl dehydratase